MTLGLPLIKLVSGAVVLLLVVAPLAADAQPAGKAYRIGMLET